MKRTLTPAQIRALIAEAPVRYRALFEFLYVTGCRLGEALNLPVECLEPNPGEVEGWFVHIRERPAWKPKRPASIRTITVPGNTVSELLRASLRGAEFRRSAQSSEGAIVAPTPRSARNSLVFCDAPTDRSCQRAWNRAAEAAGVGWARGTHHARRARINQALAAGAPPTTVSEAAGHASLRTTIGYVARTGLQAELPAPDAPPVSNPPAAAWSAALNPRRW